MTLINLQLQDPLSYLTLVLNDFLHLNISVKFEPHLPERDNVGGPGLDHRAFVRRLPDRLKQRPQRDRVQGPVDRVARFRDALFAPRLRQPGLHPRVRKGSDGKAQLVAGPVTIHL